MTAVHPIRLRFSNAYLLVGDHRPVLIDTGSRGDARGIQAACAAAGVELRDLALILHTHVHSDHFGNTAGLAAVAKCSVSYHPKDAILAEQGHNGRLQGVGMRGRILSRLFSNLPFQSRGADLEASEGLRLDEFGVPATILHTPGHTAGSISVLMDSGDAIVGDILMGGYAGGALSPSRPNFHYFADNLSLAMESLDRVLRVSSGRLFVGHGGPLAHEAVLRWRASRAHAGEPRNAADSR
jgi:glyoxylase-like metal-dependent hydrolase (beta-lactamase superfamily II)